MTNNLWDPTALRPRDDNKNMYNRTTTQFDLTMKTIMIALFVFGLFTFFVDITKAADWVNDPNNCPTEYIPEGVSCSGGNVICGVSGAACIAPSLIVKRNIDSAGSQTLYSLNFGGGYLINCTAIRDSAAPYCDNETQYWCNRDASCYGQYRQTICLANSWAGGGLGVSFNCATTASGTNMGCISGRTNCDANPDCETVIGSVCMVDGLPGTRNASCGCDLPTQNFVTGIEAKFSTTSPLLWGKQFGTGDLISFSNATSSNIFVVKNDASVFMSSTLATTSEKYFYNYQGDLYWGDIKLNSGGGVYLAGSGLDLIGGNTFIVSTTQNFNWTGQHAFGSTTTFPLGVWSANGKVGISTTTLIYTLNVQMQPGSYGAFGLFADSGNLLANIGNMKGVDGEPNDTGAIALYYNTNNLTTPSLLLIPTSTSWMNSRLSVGRNSSGMGAERLRVWGDLNIDNNLSLIHI